MQYFPVVHILLCCCVFAIHGGCFESVIKHCGVTPCNQKLCGMCVAPCKAIRIPKSGKFLLVQSESISWAFKIGLQLKKLGNLLFGLESGNQVRFHWQGIWNPIPGIRNPQLRIHNPRQSRTILNGTICTFALHQYRNKLLGILITVRFFFHDATYFPLFSNCRLKKHIV